MDPLLIASSSFQFGTSGNVSPWFFLVFIILVIWSLVWKGFALWKSARNGHSTWFIILLVINTIGILEIIYILTHREEKIENSQQIA